MTLVILNDINEIESLAWGWYGKGESAPSYAEDYRRAVDAIALEFSKVGSTIVDGSPLEEASFMLTKEASGTGTVVVVSPQLPSSGVFDAIEGAMRVLPEGFQLVLDGRYDYGRSVLVCARAPGTVYVWAQCPEDLPGAIGERLLG